MTRPWILIDGNNYVHRDFHAAGPKALKVFAKRIEALRNRFEPSGLVVAFDGPHSWREDIDADYKAHRGAKPDGIAEFFAAVRERLVADAVDMLTVDGFEGDDIIATLTRILRERGQRVVIASADKDTRQCLEAGAVTQLVSIKREGQKLFCEWMTAEDLAAKFGVHPEQWIDYQCLVGDKVDGITGADRIGPKTARQILAGGRSLSDYYRNPWAVNITAKQRAAIAVFRNRLDHVRRLVTLRRDVPLPAAWFELEGVS